jgi:hypothetical protein
MIFKSADGAFSSIASVYVRRNKLVIDLFGGHECLEGAGAFVVKTLYWGENQRRRGEHEQFCRPLS